MEHDLLFTANNATYPLDEPHTHLDEVSIAENITPLEKQIGAMLIMGFEGKYATDSIVQKTISYLEKDMLGGTILFRYNIDAPEQLKELTSSLNKANPHAFIAVDQEGGKVQRLTKEKGFTGFPSAYEVANTLDLQGASALYEIMGKELHDNGINLNFGPVVDLNNKEKPCSVIGGLGRSFSEEVSRVVEYASAFIDSHHNHKVATAIKHFPGHGYASGDTHAGMVDVTNTHSTTELQPFYELINKGKADMIMTAHIINQNYDLNHPVTLSPTALKTLLRDKGYDGIIVTDDLHMGAIVDSYGMEESIIHSIQAGNDLLVVSNNKLACQGSNNCVQDYDLPANFLKVVMQAIEDGKISKERISESYSRITKQKEKLKLV